MKLYSTNINRTIISALSQLMGLYPFTQGFCGPDIPEELIDEGILFPPNLSKQVKS
jgi:hypothetical protein